MTNVPVTVTVPAHHSKSGKRIFISSTSADLRPERQAIERALRQMRDADVIGMEYFGSRSEAPKEVCLAEVAGCDVYVGVFAQRYGSIDPETGLSMTELEYDCARSHHLPCLIYQKRSDASIPSEFQDPDASARQKLDALKTRLQKDHTVTFYEDPENLATRVVLDLHNLLLENHRSAATFVTGSPQPVSPKELHIVLVTRLSLDELKNLCLYLGVPFDNLGGETLPAKSRELVQYLSARQQLDRLVTELHDMRPDIEFIAERAAGHGGSTLSEDLAGHLDGRQKRCLARARKSLENPRVTDARVSTDLATVRKVLDSIQAKADGFDNSPLPGLVERISAKLTTEATTDRYKLALTLPVIPLILQSPERMTIEGADQLRELWRQLTFRKWLWPAVAVLMCVPIPFGFLVFQSNPPLGDQFADGRSRGYMLDGNRWDYGGAKGWETPDDYLRIQGDGLALLKLDPPVRLGDFSLHFLMGIEEGSRGGWVIRAQKYEAIEKLSAYGFWVEIDNSGDRPRLFLNAKKLPGRQDLHKKLGDYELRIGDFQQKTDLLEIDLFVKGSTFAYTFQRTAQKQYIKERVAGGLPPYHVTFEDQENPFKTGTVGLMGIDKPGDRIHVESFEVVPHRKWWQF